MTLSACLYFAAAMFSIGIYGLLTRRQIVAILLSIELMANAANVVFISFARFRGGATGQIFAVFSLALTVAEVAVGLALVILVYRRHGDTDVALTRELGE